MSAFGRSETFDFELENYRKFPRIDLCSSFLHNFHSLDSINLKEFHVLFETVHRAGTSLGSFVANPLEI